MKKCDVKCKVCLTHCKSFELFRICNNKKIFNQRDDCLLIRDILDGFKPKLIEDEKKMIIKFLKRKYSKHFILLEITK